MKFPKLIRDMQQGIKFPGSMYFKNPIIITEQVLSYVTSSDLWTHKFKFLIFPRHLSASPTIQKTLEEPSMVPALQEAHRPGL